MDSYLVNSIEFLTCARGVISDAVMENKNLTLSERKVLKNYIFNEASDYEVIHMLVREELPSEKYNLEEEHQIFAEFKHSIVENLEVVTEMIGMKNTKSILNEVGSVTGLGYSSNKVIMEFIENNPVLQAMNEQGMDTIANFAKGSTSDEAKAVWGAVKKAAKAGESKALAMDAGVEAGIRAGLSKAAALGLAAKAWMTSFGGNLKAQGARLGTDVQSVGSKAYSGADAAATGAVTAPAATTGLQALAAKVGALGVAGKIGVGLGGLAAAALLAYGAYKTYQRFFSQAAKACSGKSGADKTACIKTYKINAMKKQIQDLKGGMAGCAKTKDPAKCKASVSAKIQKLNQKLTKFAV